jgi:hypothetical protein
LRLVIRSLKHTTAACPINRELFARKASPGPRLGDSQFVGWTPKVRYSNAVMALTTNTLFDTRIDATPYR